MLEGDSEDETRGHLRRVIDIASGMADSERPPSPTEMERLLQATDCALRAYLTSLAGLAGKCNDPI